MTSSSHISHKNTSSRVIVLLFDDDDDDADDDNDDVLRAESLQSWISPQESLTIFILNLDFKIVLYFILFFSTPTTRMFLKDAVISDDPAFFKDSVERAGEGRE